MECSATTSRSTRSAPTRPDDQSSAALGRDGAVGKAGDHYVPSAIFFTVRVPTRGARLCVLVGVILGRLHGPDRRLVDARRFFALRVGAGRLHGTGRVMRRSIDRVKA